MAMTANELKKKLKRVSPYNTNFFEVIELINDICDILVEQENEPEERAKLHESIMNDIHDTYGSGDE